MSRKLNTYKLYKHEGRRGHQRNQTSWHLSFWIEVDGWMVRIDMFSLRQIGLHLHVAYNLKQLCRNVLDSLPISFCSDSGFSTCQNLKKNGPVSILVLWHMSSPKSQRIAESASSKLKRRARPSATETLSPKHSCRHWRWPAPAPIAGVIPEWAHHLWCFIVTWNTNWLRILSRYSITTYYY